MDVEDPYDFALDDDDSDSSESYVRPAAASRLERTMSSAGLLDKAKALLEKKTTGVTKQSLSSDFSLSETSTQVSGDGRESIEESVKDFVAIPRVDDDYSEDDEEVSILTGIESERVQDEILNDNEEVMEERETVQEVAPTQRAEAKPSVVDVKEEKRAQAKRQRAARESARRENLDASQISITKDTKTQVQFYVEFSVRLGSVSLRNLDSTLRDAYVSQIAETLGVTRSVVSIQGARESFVSEGCVLETRVCVRDGAVARALGSVLARAPPMLESAMFSDTQYLATILVCDGQSSTRFQFAESTTGSRDASTDTPKRISTGDDQDDKDDGLSKGREVATQFCGNHAGTQANFHVSGLDGTAAFAPLPVSSSDSPSQRARLNEPSINVAPQQKVATKSKDSSFVEKELHEGPPVIPVHPPADCDHPSSQHDSSHWDPWSFYGCFPPQMPYGSGYPMLGGINPFLVQRNAHLEKLLAHAYLGATLSPPRDSLERQKDDVAVEEGSEQGENEDDGEGSRGAARGNAKQSFPTDLTYRLIAKQDEFRRQLAGIRQRIALQRLRTDAAESFTGLARCTT